VQAGALKRHNGPSYRPLGISVSDAARGFDFCEPLVQTNGELGLCAAHSSSNLE
jgi:hypothetical protein